MDGSCVTVLDGQQSCTVTSNVPATLQINYMSSTAECCGGLAIGGESYTGQPGQTDISLDLDQTTTFQSTRSASSSGFLICSVPKPLIDTLDSIYVAVDAAVGVGSNGDSLSDGESTASDGEDSPNEATSDEERFARSEERAAVVAQQAATLGAVLNTTTELDPVEAQSVTNALSTLFVAHEQTQDMRPDDRTSAPSTNSEKAARQIQSAVDQLARASSRH